LGKTATLKGIEKRIHFKASNSFAKVRERLAVRKQAAQKFDFVACTRFVWAKQLHRKGTRKEFTLRRLTDNKMKAEQPNAVRKQSFRFRIKKLKIYCTLICAQSS
jgi:hypothetical protein